MHLMVTLLWGLGTLSRTRNRWTCPSVPSRRPSSTPFSRSSERASLMLAHWGKCHDYRSLDQRGEVSSAVMVRTAARLASPLLILLFSLFFSLNESEFALYSVYAFEIDCHRCRELSECSHNFTLGLIVCDNSQDVYFGNILLRL